MVYFLAVPLTGKAYAVAENEKKKWMDIIFEEQPYLANVDPGDTREIGIIFCIDQAEVEYFNLGVNPSVLHLFYNFNSSRFSCLYQIQRNDSFVRKGLRSSRE